MNKKDHVDDMNYGDQKITQNPCWDNRLKGYSSFKMIVDQKGVRCCRHHRKHGPPHSYQKQGEEKSDKPDWKDIDVIIVCLENYE